MSLYPNSHTSANVAASDTLSDTVILQAVQMLEQQNNVPFDDGFYRLFISPSQWVELLQDPKVRDDIKWSQAGNGNNNPMLSGYGPLSNERGLLHGCRIIVTNYIPTATENALTVQKAFLLAPRFAAIAYKRTPEIIVDPTLYDFGRRRRFGVVADYDIKPIHAERAVVITTV